MFLVLALSGIGVFHAFPQQTEIDRRKVDEIRTKAEAGEAESELLLGVRYDQGGEGVAKDQVEAVKWYRKAAEQNLARAQEQLGICYGKGEGVAKDKVEAVKWYRKAAEQNFAEAQYNLGNQYRTGEGVAKDQVEAVKWYRKAVEQNLAEAQSNLGNCYFKGVGVAEDLVEAYSWSLLAAGQGNTVAKGNLTKMEHSMTHEQIAEGRERAHNPR